MGATVPANAFLEKHIKNGNTRIFYSPVSRVSIYSSKILTCFLFMALALTINIIIFDTISLVNFGSDKIGYVILLIINFVLFLTILSSAICVTLHSEELTNVILSNSMSVLGFLSGIFFPIASLGAIFEKIASFMSLYILFPPKYSLLDDSFCGQQVVKVKIVSKEQT